MAYRMRRSYQRGEAATRPQPLPLQGPKRNEALVGLGVIADNLINIGRATNKKSSK
jgi:hypothetical protein